MLGKMVEAGVLVSVSYGVYDLSEEEKSKIKHTEQLREQDAEVTDEPDQEELFFR